MDVEYLNKVLTSEESHLPNISTKIAELVCHINDLKNDVRVVVDDGSINFQSLIKENNKLKVEADNLIHQMTVEEEKIEGEIKNEISSCADELENLSSSLKEVNLFLITLKQLVEINSNLQKAKEKMESQDFFECAVCVKTLKELVKNNSQKLKDIKVFKVLSQEVILMYEQLMYHISQTWSQCVVVDVKNVNDSTKIDLVVDIKLSSALSQILRASDCLSSNSVEKKFANLLLNKVLNNIILKKSNVQVEVGDKAILTIEVINKNNKSNYLEVFYNIKTVMNFLQSYLDVKITENQNFINKVGSFIADDFANNMIKNCLSETIPNNSEDLEKYHNVVKDAGDLEEILKQTGFLPENFSSLLDYAKNVNVLFANKFCQSYLNEARKIMKKDLHNIIPSDEIISDLNVLPKKYRTILRTKLNIPDDTCSFPKCQISKQAEELMTLSHSIIKEIQKSQDLCAVRLFLTLRNIFEMYTAVVPLHHKRFLETLPQQPAIFHNNCMYFAHYLVNLATKCYNTLPDSVKNNFPVLLEEAVVLRTLAAQTLETVVTNQRSQLIYILRDSGFSTLCENSNLDPNSEKSIRQCMRQLQLLQNVWSGVLPVNVYNGSIGFLLNAVVEELIDLIIVVEDISSQTASDLVSSFNLVLDRGSKLFSESWEIPLYVKKWKKFKEFVLLLKGSLRDIDDRWADGMGPLSVDFTAEQVKHMIRALFQNSERRAALLARIK